MKRWIAIGLFYGALLAFGTALGGANGFGVAFFAAVFVLGFMTLMAFIGTAYRMWARRLYRDMTQSEVRSRLSGSRSG
jgi:hypothetical protein